MGQNTDIVRRNLRAWDALDADRVAADFAEDGVLHHMPREPHVGREAIRRWAADITAPITRSRIRILHVTESGPLVFVERVDEYTYNDRTVVLPVVAVIELENGKIKEWRDYFDGATAERQMGTGDW